MHQPQVLSKVIFPVERPRVEPFVFALSVVVRLDVIAGWVVQVAVYASFISRFLVCDDGAERSAYPLCSVSKVAFMNYSVFARRKGISSYEATLCALMVMCG